MIHTREGAAISGRGDRRWLDRSVLGTHAEDGSSVVALSSQLETAWSVPLIEPDFVRMLAGCRAWENTTFVATIEQVMVLDTTTGTVIAERGDEPSLGGTCRFDEVSQRVVAAELRGADLSQRLVAVDRDLRLSVLWEGEPGTTIGPIIGPGWAATWHCESASWPPELAVVDVETGDRLEVPGEHYAGIETVGDHQLVISTDSQAEGVRCTLVDLKAGSIVWSTALAADWHPGAVPDHIATAFVVVGDVIVARSGKTGELVGLDVQSGKTQWRTALDKHVAGRQDLVVYGETVVASHGVGLITQLDTNGDTIDQIDLGMACIGAPLQASRERILVAGLDAIYELTPNHR